MQAEPSQISDSDPLHAVAREDEAALAAVYERYRLILFGLILRILHDREEAEDVLQEVFLQVWRRAGDFDEARGRAFTWLVILRRGWRPVPLHTGRDMKTTHHGLGITSDDWDASAKHLIETLDKFNVPQAEKDELLAFVGTLKKDTVDK